MKTLLSIMALFSSVQLFSQSLPRPAELFLSNGASLQEELNDFSGVGYVPPDKAPDLVSLFDRKSILCVRFD